MMRKISLIAIGCIALAVAVWASGDPWKDKPYQQWDAKDLQKIFQDSPWSHLVRVDAPWLGSGGGTGGNDASSTPVSSGGAAAGRTMGAGGGGGGGGANMGGGGDYGGGVGGGPSQASFLVRWISSRTFREAMIRDRVIRGQMTDAEAQAELAKPVEGYELVVTGPDMTPFENMDENSLKTAATLTLKHSKTKLTPTAAPDSKDRGRQQSCGRDLHFSG